MGIQVEEVWVDQEDIMFQEELVQMEEVGVVQLTAQVVPHHLLVKSLLVEAEAEAEVFLFAHYLLLLYALLIVLLLELVDAVVPEQHLMAIRVL